MASTSTAHSYTSSSADVPLAPRSPALDADDGDGFELNQLRSTDHHDRDGPELDPGSDIDVEDAHAVADDADLDDSDHGREEETSLIAQRIRTSKRQTRKELPYSPEEERRVVKKLDRKLVLFLGLLYCLGFLDRTNIGNARIAGLTTDLTLTSSQYEWLLWAFYITYILSEPLALLYRLLPARLYIPLCVLTWGAIATAQSLAPSFSSLLVLRAALGIAEAAFGPGVPFYLSLFFRRDELALRTGLFISASPLSASVAGLLAWAVMWVGGMAGVNEWRLLFAVEGLPSVGVGVWALWRGYVPDGPGKVAWLGAREREVAVARMVGEDDDESKRTPQRKKKRRLDAREILHTLRDPKCYITAIIFLLTNIAFSSLPVFLPTILNDMGHTPLISQALTAPPYLLSFACVLVTAYASDRQQLRAPYIIGHALLATSGYAVLALCAWKQISNTALRYAALFPAAVGFYCVVTLLLTWTLNNQATATRKASSLALVNLIGQMGPLIGTSIFPAGDGPWYVRGMSVCAAAMAMVAVLAGVLRWVLVRENRRALGGEGKGGYAEVGGEDGMKARKRERFVYML